MESNSKRLTFTLTKEQAGPFPVSTETLWCDDENGKYRVKNIPFFIDGISFDDLISVSKFDESTYQISSVVKPSGNSTIWIYVKENMGMAILDNLRNMGCGVESGVINNYFAVNVPFSLEIDKVLALINHGKQERYLIADYPSIRHQLQSNGSGSQ